MNNLTISPQELYQFQLQEAILFAQDGNKMMKINLLGAYELWYGREIIQTFTDPCEACEAFNNYYNEPVSITRFIKDVASYFGTTPHKLNEQNKNTKQEWVIIRHFIALFLKQYTNKSYADIGMVFGKDHATAMNSCKTINSWIDTNKKIAAQYKDLDGIAQKYFKPKIKY